MKIRILYSKKSVKFLSGNSNLISEDKVDKLLQSAARILINNEELSIDLKKLKGPQRNLYRIRKGKIRIIFRVYKNEIVLLTVEDIGFRGSIY